MTRQSNAAALGDFALELARESRIARGRTSAGNAAERDGTAIGEDMAWLRPAERFRAAGAASGSASFKAELASRADGLVVLLVRSDDALHQRVAHHVLLVELHEADAFDALQHLRRLDQAAAAARWAGRSA